jgi:hypothetical protein
VNKPGGLLEVIIIYLISLGYLFLTLMHCYKKALHFFQACFRFNFLVENGVVGIFVEHGLVDRGKVVLVILIK